MKATVFIFLSLLLPFQSYSQDYDHSMMDALEILSGIKSGFEGASESLKDVDAKDKGHTMGYSEFTNKMLDDLSKELKEIEDLLDEKGKNLSNAPGDKVNHEKAVQLTKEIEEGIKDLEKELKSFGSKGGKDKKKLIGNSLDELVAKCDDLEKSIQNIALK